MNTMMIYVYCLAVSIFIYIKYYKKIDSIETENDVILAENDLIDTSVDFTLSKIELI